MICKIEIEKQHDAWWAVYVSRGKRVSTGDNQKDAQSVSSGHTSTGSDVAVSLFLVYSVVNRVSCTAYCLGQCYMVLMLRRAQMNE